MTQIALNTQEAVASPTPDRSARAYTATRLGGAALDAATRGWKLILESTEGGTVRHPSRSIDGHASNTLRAVDSAKANS